MDVVQEITGLTFTLTGTEPYTRKDGRETSLTIWKSNCKKCGREFEIRATANANPNESKAFRVIHCQQHRLTQAQITARWRKAIQRKRRSKNKAASGN